jgi:hypothetical protein
MVSLTVQIVLKLYSNIKQLANQPNNYNLLILINSYEELSKVLYHVLIKFLSFLKKPMSECFYIRKQN